MQQEKVLFKAPIIEFENGQSKMECEYNKPIKITVKLETVAKLDKPLIFAFTYTDGEVDQAIKEVTVNAPEPKKQKFSVELNHAEFAKDLSDVLRSSCIVIDAKYEGKLVSRGTIMIGAYDKTKQYVLEDAEDSFDDFEGEEYEEGEEEEVNEDEEEQEGEQNQNEEDKNKEGLSFDQLKQIKTTAETLKNFSKTLSAKMFEGVLNCNVDTLDE